MVSHSKKLRDVRAFGTDGDEALTDAFAHNFPSSKHLRCHIHLKRNVAEKLKGRGFPSSTADEFLADIFGKRSGCTYEEGLVDSEDVADFDARLLVCKAVWLAREGPYVRDGQLSFFDYFQKYYANVVRYNMLKQLRIDAGLGNPPDIFTTNSSESINAVLKRKVNFKESEWSEFNRQLKEIVDEQREETIRVLSGRGQYRLCKPYHRLEANPQGWIQMSTDQKRQHVQRFDSASLRPMSGVKRLSYSYSTVNSDCSSLSMLSEASPADISDTTLCAMSIPVEDCGIQSLAFETLSGIWVKAEQYIKSAKDVVPAPGDNDRAMTVSSKSSKVPHFVIPGSNGQYSCDSNCLQWKSS